MKVMIMAAGKGTRLRPITDLIPKPMAPIANRPALYHIVRLLHRHGLDDIVMNVHHLPETITDYFGEGEDVGVRIHYSHEPELLGTAGGVKNNELFLRDGPCLVISGDALTDIDLTALVAAHERNGSIATLAVKETDDPTLYGVVVTDENDRVLGFQEKPKREEAISNLCNCGIYVLSPEIFDHILPTGQFDDFGRRVFPALLEQGIPFHAETLTGYWSDVGNLEEYLKSNGDALAGRVEVELPGRELRPGLWVEDGCDIDDSVEIEGPVLIGQDCTVQSGAYIEGPTVIGDGCVVEEGSYITRGVVLPRSVVPSGSVLVGGVLAQRFTSHDCGR